MKNLLVSFSGGETSAYMAGWLWKHKRKEFNMVFVFANTSLELQETYNFVMRCEQHFGIKVHYVEAKINPERGKGTTYTEVQQPHFLKDSGEVFEAMVEKYGLPNPSFKHCSRELKANPITSFGKDYFNGEPFWTAIGIRADECDRVSVHRKERRLLYPLIEMRPMTKKKINAYWKRQPFRLELKGYEGNCTFCWKKSDKKLMKLTKERWWYAQFLSRIENKYCQHYPSKPEQEWFDEDGRKLHEPPKLSMFRGHRSYIDFELAAKDFDEDVKDENDMYDDDESCEAYAECGIDN